jgi:hypothetical protein
MRQHASRSVRKTRQFKSTITVKAKPARRPGTCNGCGSRFEKGADITYVRHRIRRYHTSTCVPANVGQAPSAVPVMPKNPLEAAHAAMLAMENALVAKAKQFGITPEIEKAFDHYQKLKSVALRPGSDQEGKQALKLAIIAVVKMVF